MRGTQGVSDRIRIEEQTLKEVRNEISAMMMTPLTQIFVIIGELILLVTSIFRLIYLLLKGSVGWTSWFLRGCEQ